MEKKRKKLEDRKEIIKDISKGYFADLHEFRRSGGKRYFALGKPSELKDSSPFPEVKAKTLSKKEVDLQQAFAGHVTLVLLWFRAFGEVMCDKYRLPFTEHFHAEPLAQHYEINVVDGIFFKAISRLLENNLRKQKAIERHDNYLCFRGNSKPLKEQFLENKIVGHAFLVDCNGLVRWKAHANPTEEEIKYMLDCSNVLLKDTQKTLNNKVTSSSR
ncbi:hypothetical protein OS493_006537 [Desmophyllum pertusum]|uniref:Mitochondrial ATPase complex subunit ATP10 n=1 Tax=Desmophyllum pertusum TaxID=174260 RepID=A0A9X0DAM6_9CNID|nr:hypothetical protein OS493_006537 [Desmophyllum pertusum]